jgi:hypothetical protein
LKYDEETKWREKYLRKSGGHQVENHIRDIRDLPSATFSFVWRIPRVVRAI